VLVSLSDVTFGYAAEPVFEGLTFQVNPRERIGVVGPNGHGKTTLLRLLAGTLPAESGERSLRRGVSIGYLRQSQELPDDVSVHDLLLATFPEVLAVKRRLDEVHERMAGGDDPAGALREFGELQHRFEELDGYALEARADALASEVGFTADDLQRPAGSLSGGERTRFELARVLLRAPDLLLLDEPTNHLDLVQTERLERRLSDYPNAFLLVSHDRAFLRATCETIVEVERKGARRYSGGYDRYHEQREARLKRALAEYVRQHERIERTEDFIRRNIAGQKTKQAQARRKMLEKIERMERPHDVWEAARHLGMTFAEAEHPGGKEMIRARDVTVGFAGKPPLIRDFDWTLHRGERVGLVGPNGAGKTSLLRALLGRAKPREGYVELGYRASVGYLDQKLRVGFSEGRSLIEEVRAVRPDLTIGEARDALGRYRFLGEDAHKTVAGLSGGERCRLALLKVSLEPRNLLVLDEPTNHLDIPAQEVLERALNAFSGSLIVVSHDREFLDNVVRAILWIEDGRIRIFEGNWTRVRRKVRGDAEGVPGPVPKPAEEERSRPSPGEKERESGGALKPGGARREEARRRRRERTRAQNRLARLEGEIAELEERSRELNRLLVEDPNDDWEKVHRLANEEQTVRARLDRRYAEWERLTELLEEGEGAGLP
jgi:ATP-binding cassette subfamily F protein 3